MRMKRRNPVGASQNRAKQIGRPAKLGYGAKLNVAKTEGGLLSSLVSHSILFIITIIIYYRDGFAAYSAALAASCATRTGSGTRPSRVNLLSRMRASSGLQPKERT